MKRTNGRQNGQHELQVLVAEQGMARPGEYRRWGGTCTSAGADMRQSNVSGWRRCGGEVFVGHCAAARVWSKVSLLTRPEMVERVEDVEAKLGVRSELKPSIVNFT